MAEFASVNQTEQKVVIANKVFALAGGREVVSTERAIELITEANIDDYTAVNTIRLSNKSITEGAAEVFAKVLVQCINVTVVDISDCIAGRPEDEALRSLSSICDSLAPFSHNLIEVNVSDNALGVKGVNACRPILIGKKLEKVYFCNNGMSAEAAGLIGELIAESKPPLALLHFFNNMSGNGGGFALGKLITSCGSTLRDIRFSATRCMEEGCAAMLEALNDVQTLVHLDIGDNNFGAVSKTNTNGELLARCVSKHVMTLQTLNLRDCGLGWKAIDGLISKMNEQLLMSTGKDAKETVPVLRLLDLSGNELSPIFCTHTCTLLKPFAAALETFHLEDNDEIITVEEEDDDEDSDDDEEEEEEAGNNSNNNKGLSKSVQNAVALGAGFIAHCHSLTTLSMLNCELNTACAFAILSSVRNTSGKTVTVKLDGNCFSEAGCELLTAAVEDMEEGSVVLENNGEFEDNNEVDEEEDDVNVVAVTAALAARALELVADMSSAEAEAATVVAEAEPATVKEKEEKVDKEAGDLADALDNLKV